MDDEKIVLTIEGDNKGQFTMKGKMNGNPFQTMVDSGSPVTIFAIDEIKQIMKRKILFIRELPEDEEYVDFNKRKLQLLGYIFCHLEVGDSKLNKARILIANKGAKSLIGRDWLNAFNYKFVSPTKDEGNKAIYTIKQNIKQPNKTTQPSEHTKPKTWNDNDNNNEKNKLRNQFSSLFTRQGQIRDHTVKIEFKPEAKITQQKGRRVPIQLQDALQEEIERLLNEGQIERVTDITDKKFIQPVVKRNSKTRQKCKNRTRRTRAKQ